MPHDIVNGHIGHIGHNHSHDGEHLHSHMPDADRAEELKVLTTQFIEGFMDAKDKMAYLRLAGVPLEKADTDGGPTLKLVDVTLTTEWQVGTASPSFGSKELSYLPYPGPMVAERTNMGLVYVSLHTKHVEDVRNFVKSHNAVEGDVT